MGNYKLKCLYPGCGKEYISNVNSRLQCDDEINGIHGPSLLKAIYEQKQLTTRELPGVFQYIDWLPVGPYYVEPSGYPLGRPFVYKSEGLARRLGLKSLHIAFSGYWPDRGANLITRTFKELESQSSIVRYLNTEENPFPLIVSSAGNTANGYNLITHLLGLPLYLVVPESALDKLLLPFEASPVVIVVKGDYFDAIMFADDISKKVPLTRDGGVRNIARRAGLSTVMLNAVAHPEQGTHELFDHYFQAVGSGAGSIAAWEAVQLLLLDGRFGDIITKIHVAQNSPFTPICDAWEIRSREVPLASLDKNKLQMVTADVLTNRYPAYSIAGGIFDILTASEGKAWRVNNYHVFHAARMFRETEGIDIGPSAAVAVDALRQAVIAGEVKPKQRVLLHITGGGKEVQYCEGNVYQMEPAIVVKPGDLNAALEKIGNPHRILHHKKLLKKYIY
jgi:cysteate synthase